MRNHINQLIHNNQITYCIENTVLLMQKKTLDLYQLTLDPHKAIVGQYIVR